ncbi:MAG: disulfide oxidoreductase, partial [Pseudomonadota bacterium]
EEMTGLARGFAFRLVESLGVIPRADVATDVKDLDQDARGALRKHGVRFGQFTVFMPLLLKPAPTRLRLVLWSLASGLDEFPEAPPPGLVTVPAVAGAPEGYYQRAGYRLAGARAIRIDMLERLADMIRGQDTRGGFEGSADMLSITGLTLDQFADLMQGLGYKAERGERPKVRGPRETDAAAPTDAAPAELSATEPTATTDGPPETDPAAADAPEAPEVPVAADEAMPETAAAEPIAETAVTEAASVVEANAPPETAPVVEETSTDAPDTDGEPEVEVFYTFTWAPKRRGGDRPQGKRQDGPRKDGKPGQRGAKSDGRNGKLRGKPKGKPGDKGPKVHTARPPRQEKPIDPDNPFAALLALKNKD